MAIKNVKGWYLPDWDKHFEDILIRNNDKGFQYQGLQREYALSFIKDFKKNCIDVGSNIGFWSKDMCLKFNHVYAFEPLPDNIECYKKNLKEFTNYTLYDVAVSNVNNIQMPLYISSKECGNASLNNFGVQTGTTGIEIKLEELKTITVHVKKIDDYNFKNIGFIKVDCQVHEKEVIEGAIETIKQSKPVLCLELPARDDTEKQYRNNLIEYLKKYDYILKGNKGKENIFVYEQ
jgi:FkbM family methyltransferase